MRKKPAKTTESAPGAVISQLVRNGGNPSDVTRNNSARTHTHAREQLSRLRQQNGKEKRRFSNRPFNERRRAHVASARIGSKDYGSSFTSKGAPPHAPEHDRHNQYTIHTRERTQRRTSTKAN